MLKVKLLLAGLVLALPIVGWVAMARAADVHSGENVAVAHDETVDRTVFAAGRVIDIAGTVNGDVFCGAQDMTISGTVNGDVLCAAQDVHILGTVNGSVRVVAQNVTVSGTISRTLSVASQDVTVESSGKVNGDATIGAQDTTVNGIIGRDLLATSGLITINGGIGRDVRARVDHLMLGSDADISGNVAYTSARGLDRERGAKVAGTVVQATPAGHQQTSHYYGALVRGSALFALYLFVSLLIVAMVLALLFPALFQTATDSAVREPLKTVVVGLVAGIIVPAIIVVLIITVVGLPLAILLLLAWLAVLILSGPFAAYFLGRLLLIETTANPLLYMLLGAVILLVLYFIPFVGLVTTVLTAWFGIGIILLQIPRLPRPNYDLR